MAGKIQVSRSVRFISKAGTFTAMLQSNRGQLWQSYLEVDGNNGSTIGSITPSFPDIQPELMFVVVSSRTNSTVSVSSTPQWYFGNIAINDGNTVKTSVSINGQTVNFSQYFELISPSTGQPYYGLKIKKNLVELAQMSSIAIKAVGQLTGLNFSDEIQAEHTINIYPQTTSGAQIDVLDVTVVSTTPSIIGRNFTFTADGQSITMQAKVYIGALTVSTGLTYQWQRISGGSWVNISGATSATLTVTESQVETYGQYRAAVYKDGVLLGYGTASIMDATDPYILNPQPVKHTTVDPNGTNGAGLEFLEDDGDYIRYTPLIVRRSAPQQSAVDGTPTFNFVFTDSAGASVAPGTGISLTGVTYADVTYAMGEAHGDINVVIETVQDVSQLH